MNQDAVDMTHPRVAPPDPVPPSREQTGRDVMSILGIDADALVEQFSGLDPRFPHSVIEFVFGEFVARPELDLRTRQLATVAVLSALGGCEPQLETHIAATLRAGATPVEIVALIGHVLPYAGTPRVVNAMNVARRVLGDVAGPTA